MHTIGFSKALNKASGPAIQTQPSTVLPAKVIVGSSVDGMLPPWGKGRGRGEGEWGEGRGRRVGGRGRKWGGGVGREESQEPGVGGVSESRRRKLWSSAVQPAQGLQTSAASAAPALPWEPAPDFKALDHAHEAVGEADGI